MVDEHNFEDRELYYRFRQDGNNGSHCIIMFFVSNVRHYSIPLVNSSFPYAIDPAHLSPAGPSVASLKSDCGVKFGPAQRKGLLKWQQVFIVLRPEDDTLYEFRTDLVRNKESFIYL